MGKENTSTRSDHDIQRFDRWSATYNRSIMQRLFFRPVHSKMFSLLLEYGPKAPDYLIDVGCGTGRFLRAASARWPEAQLYGVDPAAGMVSEASRLNPNVEIKLATAEALPFPDQAADIGVSSLSFHHWADHQKGVQEIARVLRPGGFFCLADHTFLLSRIFRERVQSRRQIQELMSNAGLKIKQQQGMGIPFVLITLTQK
jgi:ubiquinone/menaquinone biosynthesis C-methylase UbiE